MMDRLSESVGAIPNLMLMNQPTYLALLDHQAYTRVLGKLLAKTPRRRFYRRYVLRRLLGQRRLYIVWPWADWKRNRLRNWWRYRHEDWDT